MSRVPGVGNMDAGGYFHLRRVFLFSSEGTLIQKARAPPPRFWRQKRPQTGGKVLQTQSSARQRQQNSRRSKSSHYNCAPLQLACS